MTTIILFKGDKVQTKSGEIGEVIDTWGIARDWCKLKTSEGKIIYITTERIDYIIQRNHDHKRKRRKT